MRRLGEQPAPFRERADDAGAERLLCGAASATSRPGDSVGRQRHETPAFLNGAGKRAVRQEAPKGLIGEGYVAKVDFEGNVSAAWKEMSRSVDEENLLETRYE